MKILVLNQHPSDVIGGSEIQCDLIATHLTRLGHEVVYFAVNGKQQKYGTSYPVEPGMLTWKELRRIIAKYRPELVLWRFSKRKFLSSVLALKFMRVKIVFSVSNISDVTRWSHKIRFHATTLTGKLRILRSFLIQVISNRINHFGYYFIDGVIAQTEQQTHQVPVRKETVIYNSADATVVPFSWKKPFIIWVANLKSRKNPEAYIDLARSLQDTGIDFLMVGKIISSKYNNLLNDSFLPPNVQYLGTKQYPEVNGIIQEALFLVHTTYGPEGFPNVFIQAWLQGKPVVSLYCDPDNLIQNNKLGYFSRNVEQLIKDTKVLIDNETLRHELGQRAKTFAEGHFNPEKNIRRFETFFQEVCKQ
jgi:glycosyltransferase involved in cell wall biosynthesis